MIYDETSSPGHHATAVFSDDKVHRYSLTRQWGSFCGVKALFIMLNPSTADAFKLDPTVNRCRLFAERLGCDLLQVVNIFSYRSTDPAELYDAHEQGVKITDEVNDETIRGALESAKYRICAWGAEPIAKLYIPDILREKYSLSLHALGVTKDGSPRHPLYLRKDAPLIWWRPPHDE